MQFYHRFFAFVANSNSTIEVEIGLPKTKLSMNKKAHHQFRWIELKVTWISTKHTREISKWIINTISSLTSPQTWLMIADITPCELSIVEQRTFSIKIYYLFWMHWNLYKSACVYTIYCLYDSQIPIRIDISKEFQVNWRVRRSGCACVL